MISSVKGMDQFTNETQERIMKLYEMQMAAFGGTLKGNELKEVFMKDGFPCVRFMNGDFYHYQLDSETWF